MKGRKEMKQRRIVFTLIVLLVFSLLLSACSTNQNKNETAKKDTGKETTLLQEIKDRGVMKVGVMVLISHTIF